MTHCGGYTRPFESHYAVVLNVLAVNERKSDDIFKVITNPKPKKALSCQHKGEDKLNVDPTV